MKAIQASVSEAIPECTVRSKKSRLERFAMLLKCWLTACVGEFTECSQTETHCLLKDLPADILSRLLWKDKWKKAHTSTAAIPSYFWTGVTTCLSHSNMMTLRCEFYKHNRSLYVAMSRMMPHLSCAFYNWDTLRKFWLILTDLTENFKVTSFIKNKIIIMACITR